MQYRLVLQEAGYCAARGKFNRAVDAVECKRGDVQDCRGRIA